MRRDFIAMRTVLIAVKSLFIVYELGLRGYENRLCGKKLRTSRLESLFSP